MKAVLPIASTCVGPACAREYVSDQVVGESRAVERRLRMFQQGK